ncbi:hypothetical protein F4860DRAFT_526229 [Xylaria cubensis]|nr:hypothetical protein F4860DRAFT_526229 [Xylaria cubensis]
MAREKRSRCASPSPSESHAQLLYHSLDQYNRENKGRRWSSITLAALFVLFLSSASGIALAIALMVKVADIGAASLPRDVILFAATISMLYICLHVRGALKDYKREGTGPPQLYGQYLHASALLVARLSIFCWAAALISTAIMIARALPVEGFLVKLPYLDLLICIGAIEYGDDIVSDMSVSRRTSLQHKKSKKSDAGSILTVPTEEIFHLGDAARYEEAMNKHKQPKSAVDDMPEGVEDLPTQEGDDALPISNPIVPSDTPPTLKVPDPTPDPAVPEPVYCPGGWRTEWNNTAQEVGVTGLPRVTEGSVDGSARSSPSHLQHTPEVISPPSATPSSQGVQSPTPSNASVSTVSTSRSWRRSSQRPVTASTSIASSAARSNLSTVRYAAEPEIAVRQAIRVVPNPAYQPPEERQKPLGGRPEPVTLLRNAQRAQKTGPEVTGETMRKPSNFSRPMQKTDTQGETESGAEKRTLCACVEDEKGETT